ncbi:hypothetical protein Lepto7375DRAFT_7195 [Leptolyngbya sp. PCC 7375]|nr:hypothetical protein Lepto7375DRAFT_7195 [Leptolyngbya sp. PCC 7375]
MYSRDETFSYFLKQADDKSCLTETQLGSVIGINSLEYYSRLYVFVCLDSDNPKNSIYLQFTFWDHSVTVALVRRQPIVPEQPVAPIYQDFIIHSVNPDPDHPRLTNLSGWLKWAYQIAKQQFAAA